MVDVVVAFTMLVLAAAIALLFAMVGELASRVPEFNRAINRDPLRPVEGAKLGHVPASWPAALGNLAADENALLLVLSSACASCEDVGRQLHNVAPNPGVALLVSCGSRETGEAFVARHDLKSIDHFIDVGGNWVRGEFGVMVSPAGLLLRRGRLESALIVQDLKSVFKLMSEPSPIPEHIGGVIA
jgi:hypothetical protein